MCCMKRWLSHIQNTSIWKVGKYISSLWNKTSFHLILTNDRQNKAENIANWNKAVSFVFQIEIKIFGYFMELPLKVLCF